MKLTVVMSAFNAEEYLAEAIESILKQTLENFTFIAVNNGSTDHTGKILDEYALKDSRMKVLHAMGSKTYVEGRMLAIEEVETEWIALMDADDIAEPDRLEKQVKFLKRNGDSVGAIGTWATYINAKGEPLGAMTMEPTTIERFDQKFVDNEPIVLIDPSSMIHLPTFYAAGGYRSFCVPAADFDLWYRIAEQGKKLVVLPEFLMRYRVHTGSDSVRKTMLQRKKSHFINFNMRRRRAGQIELSWEIYLNTIWSSWRYRFPRWWNDLAMSLYKQAATSYGERRWLKFIFNLGIAGMLKPMLVVRNIFRHKLKY